MLSPEDIERLQQRFGDHRGSAERVGQGIPPISYAVYQQVLTELNITDNSECYNYGYYDHFSFHPFERGKQTTRLVLEDLEDRKLGNFIYQLSTWLKSRYRNDEYAIDAATIGAGIVLRTYQLDVGFPFIDGVRSIPPKNLVLGFTVGKVVERGATLIERFDRDEIFPPYQTNLRNILGRFTEAVVQNNRHDYRDEIEDGAAVIYNVLDRNWGTIADVITSYR